MTMNLYLIDRYSQEEESCHPFEFLTKDELVGYNYALSYGHNNILLRWMHDVTLSDGCIVGTAALVDLHEFLQSWLRFKLLFPVW